MIFAASLRQDGQTASGIPLIRILFRCWPERTPYDEARYLQALASRGSPLVASLPAAADVRRVCCGSPSRKFRPAS